MSAHRADHVVAIAQGKGGVGKTTTTMNLAAAAAAAAGQRVLCVDLDPRYSLTRWLLPDDAGTGASLAELLRGDVDVAGAARASTLEGVSLIASPGEPLEEIEQQLASADYREEILHDALRDELDPWAVRAARLPRQPRVADRQRLACSGRRAGAGLDAGRGGVQRRRGHARSAGCRSAPPRRRCRRCGRSCVHECSATPPPTARSMTRCRISSCRSRRPRFLRAGSSRRPAPAAPLW